MKALSFIMSLLSISLFGQKAELSLRHFQNEGGLPTREIYVSEIDSKGKLWIGSDNGLWVFDGYSFKSPTQPKTFDANVINSIKIYGEEIYFNSMFGGIYFVKDDKIIPYKFNNLINKYKGKFITSKLEHVSKNQDFYISLYDLGVLKIDKKGKETIYAINTKKRHGYIGVIIENQIFGTRCITDFTNKSFDSTIVQIINLNRLKDNFTSYSVKNIIGNSGHFFGTKLKNGNFLVSVQENTTILNDNLIVLNYYKKSIQEYDQLEDVLCIRDRGKGIVLCNDFESYLVNNYKRYLDENFISSIKQDKSKGLWITSINNGLFYCRNHKLKFFPSQGKRNENYITSLAPIDKNACFYGASDGQIYFAENENIIDITTNSNFPASCDDLLYDKDTKRLYSHGGYYSHQKWKRFNLNKVGKDAIYNQKKYVKDTINNIIWGTTFRNVNAWKNEKPYLFFKEIVPNSVIRIFDINLKKDTLLIATENGLYNFHFNRTIQKIYPNILNKRINSIATNKLEILACGTKENGLILINQNNHSYKFIDESKGLSANNIRHVSFDSKNNLWVSTFNGLNKIEFIKDTFSIRTFKVDHGLPTADVYQCKEFDEQLWVATGKGLIKFEEVPVDKSSPKPIIINFSTLNSSDKIQKNTRLSYNKRNLQIEFITINNLLNGKIQYRYKIKQDDPWKYTTDTKVVLFELRSGSYQFEVQSANEDDIWSESQTFEFEIIAPWYLSGWFYGCIVVLLSALSYFYFKNKSNKITGEVNLKSELNRLEKIALQSQMNPHFLSNAFTSIQYLINSNKNHQADEYLTDLSRLLRTILDASKESSISLKEEINILKTYLHLEKIRFEEKFTYHFDIDPEIDLILTKVPPMMIQPIIENAVNHAFVESIQGSQNEIRIDFMKDKNILICKISDNGIGIKESLKRKSQDSDRSSYAIKLLNERVENYNSSNLDKIKLNFSTNKSNEGTLVSFYFPI